MRRSISLAAVAFGFVLAACAKREEPQVQAPAVVDAGARAKPVDHLAPGELVEGTQKVMGLVVPKVMTVERSFDDVAYVSGPVQPEAASKYVEARVTGGTNKVLPEGHVFDGVVAPGEPKKKLHIVIAKAPSGSGTRIQIRDATPPPVPSNTPPDEESRWKAVGMKPNGEPLDRTTLK